MNRKNYFDLEYIAAVLEGLEETIIYKLLDRAQFAANNECYKKGMSGFPGSDDETLLSIRLRYQEELDARFGRFKVPEERPYCIGLPESIRDVHIRNDQFPPFDFEVVNRTENIYSEYLNLIPKLTESGSDLQYGSSVEHDVSALQAVARRIHFGALYVAESKFRADREKYRTLTENYSESDSHVRREIKADVMNALTRLEVEKKILGRVSEKVDDIQKSVNKRVRRTIDPAVILDFYRDAVIPLTKEGEVAYLLNRPAD